MKKQFTFHALAFSLVLPSTWAQLNFRSSRSLFHLVRVNTAMANAKQGRTGKKQGNHAMKTGLFCNHWQILSVTGVNSNPYRIRGRSQTTFTRGGGRWSKKSTFCKHLYHRKSKPRGVGGQKDKSCKRSLWTPPNNWFVDDGWGHK